MLPICLGGLGTRGICLGAHGSQMLLLVCFGAYGRQMYMLLFDFDSYLCKLLQNLRKWIHC